MFHPSHDGLLSTRCCYSMYYGYSIIALLTRDGPSEQPDGHGCIQAAVWMCHRYCIIIAGAIIGSSSISLLNRQTFVVHHLSARSPSMPLFNIEISTMCRGPMIRSSIGLRVPRAQFVRHQFSNTRLVTHFAFVPLLPTSFLNLVPP
jgi:hypothetical protein